MSDMSILGAVVVVLLDDSAGMLASLPWTFSRRDLRRSSLAFCAASSATDRSGRAACFPAAGGLSSVLSVVVVVVVVVLVLVVVVFELDDGFASGRGGAGGAGGSALEATGVLAATAGFAAGFLVFFGSGGLLCMFGMVNSS